MTPQTICELLALVVGGLAKQVMELKMISRARQTFAEVMSLLDLVSCRLKPDLMRQSINQLAVAIAGISIFVVSLSFAVRADEKKACQNCQRSSNI